jgi:hypothetical protein
MQQQDTITKLKGLAEHARLSNTHWLGAARKAVLANTAQPIGLRARAYGAGGSANH